MRWIKAFFKSFGIILSMDFVAWLLSIVIDNLILGWTPLSSFANEDLRVIVGYGMRTAIFLLILFIKPLVDQMHIDADSEEELKPIYIRNAVTMCMAYWFYLFLFFFTIFRILPFWGASLYFYAMFSSSTFVWMVLPNLIFCAIVILMNVILFYDGRRNYREEKARFYAGMPKDSEE